MGVTVENAETVSRIDFLRKTPAIIKFISFEPLLTDISQMNLANIHWAIVGGESGVGSRPVQEKWILNIKDQCEKQKVPFYFKQWGGINKKKNGRTLLGKTWNNMPLHASFTN